MRTEFVTMRGSGLRLLGFARDLHPDPYYEERVPVLPSWLQGCRSGDGWTREGCEKLAALVLEGDTFTPSLQPTVRFGRDVKPPTGRANYA